jgi:transketolase
MSINPRAVRRIILSQSKRANVGHIGSCLSVVEILSAVHGGAMRAASPDDPDRDRFILSKGHAALALYAVLALLGRISDAQLDTFCSEDSVLGVHPEAVLPGIDFSTGSLGHGLPIAVGCALAARLQGSARRVFCLVSDGECNEGSVWEGAMFAGHHGLSNLAVVVDVNGQQAMDLTRHVSSSENMAERWKAFGWSVSEVDGHSVGKLEDVLAPRSGNQPHVVLARTVFGRGVAFMEQGRPITQAHLPVHPVNWHYLPMSDAEYALAVRGLEDT